jgi:hypothetical protein
MSRKSSLLRLAGILCLCCVSFILGRRSIEIERRTVRVAHEMNELDRLQLETAKDHQ